MRQRKLRDLEERLERLDRWIIKNPEELKGKWKDFFQKKNGNSDGAIYLEIGCGKGKFIVDKSIREPKSNFVALEGQENVIVRAIEKAEINELENISFLSLYLDDIKDYFDKGEIDGLYLNFSDPWPKKRHAKRRLTHRNFMEKYKDIIKSGGFIEIKTDNDELYEFTMEEIEALGYEIDEMSRDLHNSSYKDGNVTTEYEEKFSGRGKNINYVRVKFGGDRNDFGTGKWKSHT